MKIPSKQLIDQLYVLHKNFIWDKKRPKIKHSTLIADYSEGGYKDIDIKSKISSMKFSWRTRLLDNNFHPWKIIPTKIFALFGGLKIKFHPNLQLSKRCSKNIDNILLSWSEAEQKFSLNRAQILNWLGLLNCIPKAWKNKLASNSERLYSAPANLNTKQMPFITSKTAYQILLKSLVRPATAQSSPESSLHLTNVDWKKSICFQG